MDIFAAVMASVAAIAALAAIVWIIYSGQRHRDIRATLPRVWATCLVLDLLTALSFALAHKYVFVGVWVFNAGLMTFSTVIAWRSYRRSVSRDVLSR